MTGAKTVARPPTLHDAARRAIVEEPCGVRGVLVGVSAKGMAKYLVAGRYRRIRREALTVVGFDGDVVDRGRLIVCGACGAIDSEPCSTKCPRRDTGRDDVRRFR